MSLNLQTLDLSAVLVFVLFCFLLFFFAKNSVLFCFLAILAAYFRDNALKKVKFVDKCKYALLSFEIFITVLQRFICDSFYWKCAQYTEKIFHRIFMK